MQVYVKDNVAFVNLSICFVDWRRYLSLSNAQHSRLARAYLQVWKGTLLPAKTAAERVLSALVGMADTSYSRD